MARVSDVSSVILAAGRGSRMAGFKGNKTLLPLIPEKSLYEGKHPILMEVLKTLPRGPKAVVVHFKKQDVLNATKYLNIEYYEQQELDGTGGALLAAWNFIRSRECERIIITMGDVPFVREDTYESLLQKLADQSLVVLGFRPASKKQYGIIEIRNNQVQRIIEWKYWRNFPQDRQEELSICNSGIYAVRRDVLLQYLQVLAANPHVVEKDFGGQTRKIKEYFITDLVEFMVADGLSVGCFVAADEMEVMGVDEPSDLRKAQEFFRRKQNSQNIFEKE